MGAGGWKGREWGVMRNTDLQHLQHIGGGRLHVKNKVLHAEGLAGCNHFCQQDGIAVVLLKRWETARDVPSPPILPSNAGTQHNRLIDPAPRMLAHNTKNSPILPPYAGTQHNRFRDGFLFCLFISRDGRIRVKQKFSSQHNTILLYCHCQGIYKEWLVVRKQTNKQTNKQKHYQQYKQTKEQKEGGGGSQTCD